MLRTLLASLLFLLLAACAATQNAPGGEAEVRFGRVSQIDMVTIDADKKLGIGAVVGAYGIDYLRRQRSRGFATSQALGTTEGRSRGSKVTSCGLTRA